jgi:enterochelin esterase-like enzyme
LCPIAGQIVPMIWVFVDGQTDSFYGDAYDGHKQVYSHFIDEILPYVDAQYHTIAEREQRALEGFSMGGYGALLYAAKHPEHLSAVVEYGGPLMTWQNLTMSHPDTAEAMYDTIEANWLPYHNNEQLELASSLGVRTYIPEPARQHPAKWANKPPE